MDNPLEDFVMMEVEDNENAPMLFYTLQGLKHSSYYELQSAARNDIGTSMKTTHVFKTAKGRLCQNGNINSSHGLECQLVQVKSAQYLVHGIWHTPS